MTTNNSQPERINFRSLSKDFIDVFDINKGYLKTYRLLALRPGESIRKYLLEDRTTLVKPFKLLLVSTAVLVFFVFQVMPENEFINGFNEGWEMRGKEEIVEDMPDDERSAKLEKKAQFQKMLTDTYSNYYNIIMLFFIPFISFATLLLFKKNGYNLAEHFILNSYILSFQNFLYFLTLPLIYYSIELGTQVYLFISLIYFIYACHHFFQRKFLPSIIRSFLSLFIGYSFYMIAIVIIILVFALFFIKQ